MYYLYSAQSCDGIMSAWGSADLQNSTTARLASQTDQPAEPSVLPSFSENLIVDEKLKLSNENFKHLIENSFNTNINPSAKYSRCSYCKHSRSW
jgi:hypothetical protein